MPDEVRRDEVVEAIVRPVLVRAAEPAVRNERSDRAALGGGGRERAVDGDSIADVAGRRGRAELRRREAEGLEVAGEQRQARTLGGETLRDCAADPAAPAGDDDVPPLEAVACAPPPTVLSGMRSLRELSCGSDLRPGAEEHRFPSPRGPQGPLILSRTCRKNGKFACLLKKRSQFAESRSGGLLTCRRGGPRFPLAASTERD